MNKVDFLPYLHKKKSEKMKEMTRRFLWVFPRIISMSMHDSRSCLKILCWGKGFFEEDVMRVFFCWKSRRKWGFFNELFGSFSISLSFLYAFDFDELFNELFGGFSILEAFYKLSILLSFQWAFWNFFQFH
jgi:hypothetical protein